MNAKFLFKMDWSSRGPDCQLRALSNATGISRDSSLDLLVRLGWSTYNLGLFAYKAEQLPGLLESLALPKAKMSLASFIKLYPTGRFICHQPRHVFAVVDGVKIDDNPANVRIDAAWRITP